MTKTASHIAPLPDKLVPQKSSTQLINEHVQRLLDSGERQKTIALSLGFGANYVAMLKAGEQLPLSRVIAFAHAVRLSDAERNELLHARLMELHGSKGEICVATLTEWAIDLVSPVGDEGRLIEMWREATMPAPNLLIELLSDSTRAGRIRAAMDEVIQEELQAISNEAAAP